MVEVRWVDAVFLFNYIKAQILKEANKSDKTILLWLFFFFPKKPDLYDISATAVIDMMAVWVQTLRERWSEWMWE